jgi:hypothetical protein
MHPSFRTGFEKIAQSPEEDAYTRGVISGYNQAHQEMSGQQEQPQQAGDLSLGELEQVSPEGQQPQQQPPNPNMSQGAASGTGPSPLASAAAQPQANPQTVAGQSGTPNDATQDNPLQPSPPPERRAPSLAPTAAQANSPERGKVAPIPQRAHRDYGEQFAGAQAPYSSNY